MVRDDEITLSSARSSSSSRLNGAEWLNGRSRSAWPRDDGFYLLARQFCQSFISEARHCERSGPTGRRQAFADQKELGYTVFTPSEPVGCH